MEQILEASGDRARSTSLQSAGKSAVSWSAIIAGAFVAAAVSLVLLTLGSGLGFASVSPWPGRGMSATTFAVTSAMWLIVMQWIASGLGGYVAGRLRTRWIGTHTHEVFFRDTAHGLVTWAVATVLVAAVLASSASSAVVVGQRDREIAAQSSTVEQSFMAGEPQGDGRQAGGERHVDDAPAAALTDADRAKADAARKNAAQVAIYTALSMLVGAFIASVSAALGGRLRDEHP